MHVFFALIIIIIIIIIIQIPVFQVVFFLSCHIPIISENVNVKPIDSNKKIIFVKIIAKFFVLFLDPLPTYPPRVSVT